MTKFNIQTSLLLLSFTVLFGCSLQPTIVGFEDDHEYISETIVVETVVATKTDAEVVDNEEDEAKDAEVVEIRETYKSAKGYWQAAIRYLQTGNEDDARWALDEALLINPKSRVAKELLFQLDADAINAFGADYFEYKVQYGDSLSKLAKLYLNDALKFYLLAKYNDISNPGRLVVGQVINIPGDKNDPVIEAPKAEKNNFKQSVAASNGSESEYINLLNDAKEMFAAGEYAATITLIEGSHLDLEEHIELRETLVISYVKEGKVLISTGRLVEAKDLLSQAVIVEPDNTDVNMMLIDLSEIDKAESNYEKSLKALAGDDPVGAYQFINAALELQPGYVKALEKKEEIKAVLSVFYYKQALMAQRKHELDKAISYWDEVLKLDAGNDNAKLYRTKAVSLKIKLEKFVAND